MADWPDFDALPPPFLDPSAELMDEVRDHDIWPTTSRRRQTVGEWDSGSGMVGARIITSLEDEEEASAGLECPLCGVHKDTARGMAIHNRRQHGIGSPRAEYYRKYHAKRDAS